MIDYATILSRKYKGAEWTLEGDDYEGLNWISDSKKPTKAELDAQWDSVKSEINAEKQAKIDLKISAIAKLAALGLTEDEAKAIIG
jgi:hypothetical protein